MIWMIQLGLNSLGVKPLFVLVIHPQFCLSRLTFRDFPKATYGHLSTRKMGNKMSGFALQGKGWMIVAVSDLQMRS